MAIKNVNYDKYGILNNKYSKFLFYNLNDEVCQNRICRIWKRIGLSIQYVRHTIVFEDANGLLKLEKNDWAHFIEDLSEISEKENSNLENLGTEVDVESNN